MSHDIDDPPPVPAGTRVPPEPLWEAFTPGNSYRGARGRVTLSAAEVVGVQEFADEQTVLLLPLGQTLLVEGSYAFWVGKLAAHWAYWSA